MKQDPNKLDLSQTFKTNLDTVELKLKQKF